MTPHKQPPPAQAPPARGSKKSSSAALTGPILSSTTSTPWGWAVPPRPGWATACLLERHSSIRWLGSTSIKSCWSSVKTWL